jgi:Arc/MetJ-type ribon-helix-helix transcriptional regulator
MRTAEAKAARAKLSTTVSSETLEFLEHKVASGEAASLAEAVDSAIRRVRQLENRQKLAAATARYFDQLQPRAAAEEDALAHDQALAASAIDFDKEL